MDPPKTKTDRAKRRGVWALWIGVIIMFLFVISAWVVLIKIAKNNPVEQIEVKSVGSDRSD